MQMAKAMGLLKAYLGEQIPANGGFIISSFFDPTSVYSIYEITAYANVKDIYRTAEGLTFKTDGNRTHILVEPPTYTHKHEEPVHREAGKKIPYRFDDLDIFTGKKQEKIMVPREPVMLYTSFTILTKEGDNFSFIFFPTDDVYMAMRKFMADSLYNDCNLSKDDSVQGSNALINTIKNFTVWE